MSFHNVGAIAQDVQSSCKRQDAAFAATRPAYKQYMLIFQSDLVLPISVQILHISHSLPFATFQKPLRLGVTTGWLLVSNIHF